MKTTKARSAVVRISYFLAAVVAVIAALGPLGDNLSAQRGEPPQGPGRGARGAPAEQAVARPFIFSKTPGATPGYVLFSPLTSDTTYLVDSDGKVVRTWKSDLYACSWVYMLDNGDVIRGGTETQTSGFSGGGAGGRLQRFTFDGKLTWDFSYNTATRLPHHDVALLPNGNFLAIVWELKTVEEARKGGRREGFVPQQGLWPDMLVEFKPKGLKDAEVVWEWHAWDHRIQNVDSHLENYGNPAEHPERIDINGDLIGVTTPPRMPQTDIFHTNAVAYNRELDQIILSVPNFNEVWIIDHSATTKETAGSTGGKSGKGGDLLYRWGNPQLYGRGAAAQQMLGFQHNAHWIAKDLPGAGHVMIFSNRTPGASGAFSRVYELELPVDNRGRYTLPATAPYGPTEPVWSYSEPSTFQATYISGAQRLSNGNTMISSGPQGRLFEVTPKGEIVWEYWSPFSGQGATGPNANMNPYAVFRAVKLMADSPALKGRELKPMDPQPALVSPVVASRGDAPRGNRQ